MRKLRFLLPILLLFSLSLATVPAASQNTPAISIGIPLWMQWAFDSDVDLLEEFEQEHGVRVVVETASIEMMEGMNLYDEDVTIEDYLNGMENYVSMADVLLVTPYETFRPEAVTAGYFLDLRPLLASDTNFDPSVYYPGMLDAYEWDGGMWGIPANGDVIFLAYEPAVFDEVGLSYPNENWTIDDFDNAVRTLTEFNADGGISRYGFVSYAQDTALMMRALYGEGFYDPASQSAAPRFNTPEMITIMERWAALYDEGYFNEPGVNGFFGPPAMRLARRWELQSYELPVDAPADIPAPPEPPAPSLLPGGITGLETTGFAVSAGTSNPELAYELAQYLSRVLGPRTGSFPARRDATIEGFGGPELEPDTQAFIDEAYEATLSLGEQRYFNTIGQLVEQIREQPDIDIVGVLQDAELEALDYYNAAIARRDTVIIVDEPPAEIVLGSGQSVLTVVMDEFMVSSQQSTWDEFFAEFVAANPDIVAIELEAFDFQNEVVDCVYSNARLLEQDGIIDDLIAINPFMDADRDFDQRDLYNGVLDAASVDGNVYGYPFSFGGSVIWYDAERFAQAGVPAPYPGWTAEELEVTLDMLRFNLDLADDDVVIQGGGDVNSLQILVNAFGGQIWDTSVNPPAPAFADTDSIIAIQRVLDMARRNDIGYYSLTGFSTDISQLPERDWMAAPMVTGYLSRYSGSFEFDQGRSLAMWPVGNGIIPMDMDVEVGFIRNTADNPEACYNFFSALAARPDLTNAMPVSRSMLDSPLMDAFDPRMLDFFREFADVIESGEVVLPTYDVDFIEFNWVYGAFDRYVLGDETDLEGLLTQADATIDTYRTCKVDFGITEQPMFESEEDWRAYMELLEACAQQADPDYQSQFGGF